MGRTGHILAMAGYALAAALAGVGLALAGAMAAGTAALIALVLLLGAALGHESVLRRRESARTQRRILLLKRALDRAEAETAATRDAVHRLFETAGSEGGEAVRAAIDRASAARADAADREPGADPAGPSGTDSELEAEIRVLHQLVEQLYADDAPAVLRGRGWGEAFEASPGSDDGPGDGTGADRREPRLDTGAREGAARGGPREAAGGTAPTLRVVGDDRHADDARDRDDGGPDTPEPPLDEARILEIVREGLRHDRVDLYLQPIVSLPQRKRRFFECYSRIRGDDGTVITPEQYLPAARRAGLVTAVDNMLLFRCVQLLRKARRQDPTLAFFCNVSANTLSDREFFRDFIAYMESHKDLAGGLILEMSQDDFDDQRAHMGEDLQRLAEMGYRFSIDGVTRLGVDLDALRALNVQYLKMEAGLILHTLEGGGQAATELRSLKQRLDSHDVDLIVERIETERTLIELLEFNIDFGQGYLFGEPRLNREQREAARRDEQEG